MATARGCEKEMQSRGSAGSHHYTCHKEGRDIHVCCTLQTLSDFWKQKFCLLRWASTTVNVKHLKIVFSSLLGMYKGIKWFPFCISQSSLKEQKLRVCV